MKLNKYIPVAALSLMLLNSGCSDSFFGKKSFGLYHFW